MAKNSFPYKKSQGLSVNTIIIAAIALIVLVVLIAIFTGRFGLFSKGLDEIGNICKLPGTNRACCSTGNTLPDPPGGKWSDCEVNQKCCSSSSIPSPAGETIGKRDTDDHYFTFNLAGE